MFLSPFHTAVGIGGNQASDQSRRYFHDLVGQSETGTHRIGLAKRGGRRPRRANSGAPLMYQDVRLSPGKAAIIWHGVAWHGMALRRARRLHGVIRASVLLSLGRSACPSLAPSFDLLHQLAFL